MYYGTLPFPSDLMSPMQACYESTKSEHTKEQMSAFIHACGPHMHTLFSFVILFVQKCMKGLHFIIVHKLTLNNK